MTMPCDLVLVRHGESEGNLAYGLSYQGDQRWFQPGSPFRDRHGSKWRLTDRGREQAKTTGAWIREKVGVTFDRHVVSEYLRAMETAAYLGFAEARWRCDFYLRERDWGKFGEMSIEQRKREYAEDLRRREMDKFFWAPPDGESMADLCLRVDRVLNTLHRECGGQRVLLVCHGEVMWAFRVRLERISQEQYHQLDNSRDPCDKIHNGQVLHYTRRDPQTQQLAPYLNWVRSVCPWNLTQSRNEWQEIQRPSYSNADLLAAVEKTPRLIPG